MISKDITSGLILTTLISVCGTSPVRSVGKYLLNISSMDHYKCPDTPKWFSPEISLSPFPVSSDLHRHGETETPLYVFPLSLRTFKKLDLTVLPSREVCVLGMKLKNTILPSDYEKQFEIMTCIAVWFSPCIAKSNTEKRLQCFKNKIKSYEELNLNRVKSLNELLFHFFTPDQLI